jgi:hypothetical protein
MVQKSTLTAATFWGPKSGLVREDEKAKPGRDGAVTLVSSLSFLSRRSKQVNHRHNLFNLPKTAFHIIGFEGK